MSGHYIYSNTWTIQRNQTKVMENKAEGFEKENKSNRWDLATTFVSPQQIPRLVDENINHVKPESAPRRIERERCE